MTTSGAATCTLGESGASSKHSRKKGVLPARGAWFAHARCSPGPAGSAHWRQLLGFGVDVKVGMQYNRLGRRAQGWGPAVCAASPGFSCQGYSRRRPATPPPLPDVTAAPLDVCPTTWLARSHLFGCLPSLPATAAAPGGLAARRPGAHRESSGAADRERLVRNPGRAAGGRLRVAPEARVDAPLFGGSQSTAPVSVRATHRGGGTEPGLVRQGVCW